MVTPAERRSHLRGLLLLALAPAAMAAGVLGGAPDAAVLATGAIATVAAALALLALNHRVSAEERTARRRAETEMRKWRTMAHGDSLTGVRNRRGVEHDATAAERAAAGSGIELTWSVMVCDIDRFKQINDRHGHVFGDRALRLVAAELRCHAPEGATVGRMGGDEFVVYTTGPATLTEPWATDLAATLNSTPLEVDGHHVSVSFTWGIAVGAPAESFDRVIERADLRLIQRKARERDRRWGTSPTTEGSRELRGWV